MIPVEVVEPEIFAESRNQFLHREVVVEIDVFVLHAAPQSLDGHVVQRSAATVHADGDLRCEKWFREDVARELRSLVRVEYPGLPSAKRSLENARAEIRILGVRHSPGENEPAKPIYDRDEVHKAALHRDICQVSAPDLIRSRDVHPSQQVGVNLVILRWNACSGSRINRLDPHLAH